MAYFKASAQYGDWEGTAAADDADVGATSIERYLEKKGLIRPAEFLVATSLWVGENHSNELSYVSIRAFLFKGHRNFESVREALSATTGSIPVRSVDISLTLEEFVCLFKRFSVTWHDLSLEDREFSSTEE